MRADQAKKGRDKEELVQRMTDVSIGLLEQTDVYDRCKGCVVLHEYMHRHVVDGIIRAFMGDIVGISVLSDMYVLYDACIYYLYTSIYYEYADVIEISTTPASLVSWPASS